MKKPSQKRPVKKAPPPSSLAGYARRLNTWATRLLAWAVASRAMQFGLLWLVAWLVGLSFLFSEFLKDENYLEIFPSWVGFAALVQALTALIVAAFLYALPAPRRFAGKLVAVLLLALFLVDYDARLMAVADVFRSLLPLLPDPATGGDLAIISLLFLGILIGLVVLAGRFIDGLLRRYPKITSANVVLGTVLLVGFVFAGQAAQALPTLRVVDAEYDVKAPTLPTAAPGAASEKPDIYYIVLDRYTNSQVLSQALGFDNSSFIAMLRAQGFTVNDGAYANYPFTAMSIASTLTADYTNTVSDEFRDQSVQSRTLYHKLAQQSAVVQELKRAGYVYHNVGSNYGVSSKAPLADFEHMHELRLSVFGKQKSLRGIEQTAFTQSIFYRFAKVGGVPGWPLKVAQYDHGGYIVNQLATLQQLAEAEPGGRFVFAHLLSPHPPYLFNADGSYADITTINDDNIGKPVNNKYLAQVAFINQQMEQLVRTIRERSGDKAVIILNADEGPYPTAINLGLHDGSARGRYDTYIQRTDMRTWTDDWLRTKFGILQAVHIPAATADDLAHLSSVNIFRIVLNRHLGSELPYLPQCHLAPSHGSVDMYKQADVTERLTGATSRFCAALVD